MAHASRAQWPRVRKNPRITELVVDISTRTLELSALPAEGNTWGPTPGLSRAAFSAMGSSSGAAALGVGARGSKVLPGGTARTYPCFVKRTSGKPFQPKHSDSRKLYRPRFQSLTCASYCILTGRCSGADNPSHIDNSSRSGVCRGKSWVNLTERRSALCAKYLY